MNEYFTFWRFVMFKDYGLIEKCSVFWLQALLQSHSHQDSIVLAQRQKYRSMEKKKQKKQTKKQQKKKTRKPRDKPTHLWTPYLRQRRQEYTMEKRQSL